ncbi:Leucine-rich repeat protein soc-2 homolog [Gryllus bimaculatus]|nr:Leucine-rich repeat protein soc-2 homolog [Gryllus bimaculatus]
MSRNHKDKYENCNPRRAHTIMSAEDAAAGKKSHWPELEITGTIRNLSPNLWQLTHLTSLYLNDNCLSRIPPDICRLVNLRALDLSSNKLRSLPAELGELIYLRELHLNNNLLRVLPYELGKLFQLHVLGLAGNPLSKEILALYGEPNGTHKLLTYMLDNLQGPDPNQAQQPILVCTAHIHWDPEFCDVKLIQTMMLSNELRGILDQEAANLQGVIEFLTSGRVPADHKDFKFDFKGIIDYIFYSKNSMTPLGLLGPLAPEWLRENKVVGCPHPHVPSDHFPLLVELEMIPTVPPASNGLTVPRR